MEKCANEHVLITKEENGQKIVFIPQIIFKGKRTIDWNEVEKYLLRYVGDMVEITETKEVIYIGKDFPDEYKGSEYTRKIKGSAYGKVKANLVQGIHEIVEVATNKRKNENKKNKHAKTAKYGWYRYDTRFALPVVSIENKLEGFNVYSAALVVRHAVNNRLYLYDIQKIKKETYLPTMDI